MQVRESEGEELSKTCWACKGNRQIIQVTFNPKTRAGLCRVCSVELYRMLGFIVGEGVLLTLAETATMLRLSRKTLYNWTCGVSELPYTRIGDRTMFFKDDVTKFIMRHYTGRNEAA